MTQSGGLISGTILENLTSSEKDDLTSVMEALEKTHLLEEINSMEAGLNSQVGESGNTLSGGQRQRLMIAKAFIDDHPYLIFDEATAHLDVQTEALIQTSLEAMKGTKTVIMIAHRLSTIIDSDCIFFVENGRITGSGTHQELLNSHEMYRSYIESLSEVAINNQDVDAQIDFMVESDVLL